MTDLEQLQIFGSRIKEVRKIKGMTVSQLGLAIGQTEKQVTEIENGKINATVLDMYTIACAFDMKMTELYNFEI